jgi:CheY-like chemotaxis protein
MIRAASEGLILVVDDDYDVRLGISEVLEDEGYEPATAVNGAEALQLLRAGLRPRLILLDLMMPVMDGEAFCRACRDDAALRDLTIVVISADAGVKEKAERCGASAALRKPIQFSALLEIAAEHARPTHR